MELTPSSRPLSAAGPATGWLSARARATPTAIAVEASGVVTTYAELARRVERTRDALAALGVGPGMRVALLADNGIAWVRLFHAIVACGATLLPLNTRLRPAEWAFQLKDAEATVVICGSERALAETEALAVACPDLRIVQSDDEGAELTSLRDGVPVSGAGPEESPLAILYTSGTSGRPKGVALSAEGFVASAHASASIIGMSADDRWLVCMPLFHVGGLSILIRCCLAGACAVVQSGFDAAAVDRALDERGITRVSWVANMLARVLELRGDAAAPAALRCCLLGGGPAPATLLERAWSNGFPVAPTYGLTEASSQVATRDPADRRSPPGGHLVPLPGFRVRVVDETGSECAVGTPGEIQVRGAPVLLGYVGHAVGRSAVDESGFYATGDWGRMDAMGSLEVLERRDDLIISGGENIYPAEVESVLLEHPKVSEVAVVARPDETFGARPVAFWVSAGSVRSDTAASLSDHARQRLARFKVPDDFLLVDSLPRTGNGKLRRAELRSRLSRSAR